MTARASRRLHCEKLEDRIAPANLTLTNLILVDASDVPEANPVYGQMLYFQANWSASGMAGTESAPIQITANGFPLDSSPIAFAAGSSSGSVLLNGWYVGTSAISVTATIDPNNTVAETNENDNTFTLTVTPIAPTTLPQKLVQPLGRTANVDYTIGNYVDVDPRPDPNGTLGYEQDAFGGPYMYDGHDGYDEGPYGSSGMDAGFPVYAAANGTVTYASDGQYDREMYTNTSSAGNIINIDQGNGWTSVYYHLAENSLTVNVGNTVKQGQVIALMGASGFSEGGQHLHFTLEYRGAVVEALYAPTSYFINPLPYSGNVAPFAWDAFTTGTDPYSEASYTDITYEQVPRVSTFAATDPGLIYFVGLTWNIKTNSQTSIMSWQFYEPNGTLWNNFPITYQAEYDSRNDYWDYYDNVSAFAFALGTWHYDFEINGVVVKSVPFTIAATGNPSLRLSFNNAVTDLDNQIIVDQRTTPIDLGTVAQGATPPTETFTVANEGDGPMTLSGYTLPPGFSFVGTPPTSVPADSTANLVVQMNTTTVGAQFGKIHFTTSDPTTPSMDFNLSGTVTGTPPAGAPVITLTDPALGYNFASLPRVFAPDGTVTDSDSANFSGGNLKVELASGGDSYDALGIRNQGTAAGQIGVSGSTVTYGGVSIGTFTGGTVTSPLVISFNTAATPAATQALVQNLTYSNSDTVPDYPRRYIRLTLTDNTGKVSNLAIANVTPSGVANAPTIAALTSVVTVTNYPFSEAGSFSDSFGNTWTATVNYGDGTSTQPLTLNADKTFTLSHAYGPPGTYTVTVTITSDTGGVATATMTVNVVIPPTTVSLVTIDAGAMQHSRLTTITVSFATPIQVSTLTGLGAITLTRTDTTRTGGVIGTVVQTGATGANGRITISPSSGVVSSITLTFSNADGSGISAGVEYGSLADGYWQLAIPSLGYISQAGSSTLFRLFGDINGDSTVTAGGDQIVFDSAFGTTYDPNDLNNGYNAAFDFNGDGTITAGGDQTPFHTRFGVTLIP